MAGRPSKTDVESGGRERLLAAAARLFAAKGYAATTVRDILKVAKVTAPVLYYHFGSKEGLFVGLFQDGFAALESEMRKALAAAGTPGEKVRAFCRVHVEVRQRFADLRWVIEAVIAGPPKAGPRFDFKGLFADLVEELAQLVSAAVESGEFRPCNPTTAALALLGAVEMTFRARMIEGRLPAAAGRADGVLGVVLDGLRAPDVSPRRGGGRKAMTCRKKNACGRSAQVASRENAMFINRRSLRNVAVVAVLLGAVLAAGCGKRPAQASRGPAEVGVVTLAPERVVLTTELPGRTSAFLVAEVRPQVSGLIQQRFFAEGGDVKAGEVLYQIDPAQYQAAFDQAKAALAVAEANLPAARSRAERLKGLQEIHAIGEQDYDDAAAALAQIEAGVAAGRAALEGARINLAYTPIKAPISGRIGRSSVTVGALVAAYQPVPLAIVQQLDPIYVDVMQSSAEVLRLRRALESGKLKRDGEGQSKVKLLLEDGSPYPLEGTLKFADVTVDPSTGSVTLRMVFPNPDHVLLPGMFVRAVVEQGTDQAAILAPQQGVTRDTKGNPIAWVVGKAGTVEQKILEVDRAIGDKWLVTKGLAAGDQVIVEGLQRVRPGTPVKAVPFVPPAPPASGPGAESK